MPCDGEVAELTWHLSARIVAHAVSCELLQSRALDDISIPLSTKPRNVDLREQLSLALWFLNRRWVAGLRLRYAHISPSRGVDPIDLRALLSLNLFRLDASPPQLPRYIQPADGRKGEQQLGQNTQHRTNY